MYKFILSIQNKSFIKLDIGMKFFICVVIFFLYIRSLASLNVFVSPEIY